MEIIINKKTYTLANVNGGRRQFFVNNIFPYYNASQGDLEAFFLSEKEKNPEKTLLRIKTDFFKNFAKNLNLAVWVFLFPGDKKEIGTVEDVDVSKEEFEKFINFVSAKIKKYCDYVGSKSGESKTEELEPILSFAAEAYGWTFDQMKEMDELEFLRAVEEAISLKKKNNIDKVNLTALAGAYASGSKSAKAAIDKMNRSISGENNFKKLKKTNPEMKAATNFSREDFEKIMKGETGANDGR